jgi:hypothetical protein
MKKIAQDIEQSMEFLLSGDVKKSINKQDAILHLVKAKNLLENVGLLSQSSMIDAIIKRAEKIDDCDIEIFISPLDILKNANKKDIPALISHLEFIKKDVKHDEREIKDPNSKKDKASIRRVLQEAKDELAKLKSKDNSSCEDKKYIPTLISHLEYLKKDIRDAEREIKDPNSKKNKASMRRILQEAKDKLAKLKSEEDNYDV